MDLESDLWQTTGARNPYVLAEFELDRRIDWSEEDTKQVFERAFEQPYETLFDPKYDSPLYDGLGLDRDGGGPMADGGTSRVEWKDQGTFLQGYPEYDDPVQGKIGDCYLIASLSAIAWALPDHLIGRASWIDEDTPDYVRFRFTENAGRGDDEFVEVTQKLPVDSHDNPIFARCTDPTEIWPGVYEKAYAKWKTGAEDDRPFIDRIESGNASFALGEILGVEPTVWKTVENSADVLWEIFQKNSKNDDTVTSDAMVAQTYQSASDAPDSIDYDSANIAANHTYTILGHQVEDGTRYVILRNPWNETEASDDLKGFWNVRKDETSFSIHMADTDGVFGIPVSEFKKYYAGLVLADP